MVARIEPIAKVSKALQYNEQKVAQKKAELIHTKNFLQEKSRLTYAEKSHRFQHLNELNTRSKVKMLHATLNFGPDQTLSDEKLIAIADRYMEGLQMQNQPYLVYRHDDAAHPHLHIVTSLIRPDGTRINTNKMAIRLSEPTRKAIEQEFNLGTAKRKQQTKTPPIAELQKIVPGSDIPVTQAMDRILGAVNWEYSFSNFHEYNAILRQYNVIAETGGPGSKTRQYRGLYYIALDDQGNKISPPVMASQLPTRPTLERLEQKFQQPDLRRGDNLSSIRQRIDWALDQQPKGLRALVDGLQATGIEVVVSAKNGRNPHDHIYVDHRTKTAVTGETLGKTYSTNAIEASLAEQHQSTRRRQQRQPQSTPNGTQFNANVPQLLSAVLPPTPPGGSGPDSFREDQDLCPRRRL
jgi:hypothetical protein